MFQDKRQGGKSMTKEDVLTLLQGGGYVSGQRMSEQLGLSRAAIWKAIDRLRAEGYTIDSATNRGYCLTGTPNRLTQAGVERALGDHPWRALVEVLPEVDSTNNVAKAAAAQGAPHGTVILSDYQTGGRGRRGRSFSSPQGMGVYCSVVLRYDVPPDRLLHLTAVIAEATRRAIVAATGLEPQIKWTNDLVLQNRKLCGILTELSLEAETGLTGYVIPGTGVNCGQRTEDFPAEIQAMAISLEQALQGPADRCALAAEMIRQYALAAADMLTNPAPWLEGYRRHCITLGRDVQILQGGGARPAHAEDIDDEGGLIVRLPDGTREIIRAGEVSVRGLYGYV